MFFQPLVLTFLNFSRNAGALYRGSVRSTYTILHNHVVVQYCIQYKLSMWIDYAMNNIQY